MGTWKLCRLLCFVPDRMAAAVVVEGIFDGFLIRSFRFVLTAWTRLMLYNQKARYGLQKPSTTQDRLATIGFLVWTVVLIGMARLCLSTRQDTKSPASLLG